MSETYFLPTNKLELFCEGSELVMRLDGQQQQISPPRRALPLSEPDRFIVLSDIDGNEIGMIRDVAQLEEPSQQLLRDTLARIYVLTRITRVLEVEKEPLTGQTRWRVEIAVDDNTPELPPRLETPQLNGAATQTEETSDANTDGESDESGSLQKVGRFLGIGKERESEHLDNILGAQEREFLINGQEDVQTARYPHIYIVDTDRNRYEIVHCEELDPDSRRAAERFF